MLGTSEFAAKARAELRSWGRSDDHFLSVPHQYERLAEAHFAEVLEHLVHDIADLVGRA